MGDLTKNLSRHEFECKCGCGFDTVDFQLITWIQGAVDFLTKESTRPVSVKITSGNRCVKHNANEGGSLASLHTKGRAADHKLYYKDTNEQVEPEDVALYYEAECGDVCGLGRYSNRTHIDSRGIKARWSVE